MDDVCLLKDPDAFRAEWRLARVTATFLDKHGNVRNVEVKVVPTGSIDKSKSYKPVKPNYLKRHVSNLVVIVPVDGHDGKTDVQKEFDDEEVHEQPKADEVDVDD